MFIDTHCHLNFKAFETDWRETAERAVQAGVEKIIMPGANLDSSRRAVELAQAHPALFATIGVHPHHAGQAPIPQVVEELRELAKNPRVVAIGEIGLDYHVYKVQSAKYKVQSEITEEIKQGQRELFLAQLQLAADLKKPVILHSRECGEEVLGLAGGARGVFHCFGGSKKYLKRILEAGFYVGFDGDITYVPDRAGVAATAPLNRLLLETDSPYLTPIPHRGERNEPAYVVTIAQKQASLRGVTVEEVATQTTMNAGTLFGIS